jgi:hypothetical protein
MKRNIGKFNKIAYQDGGEVAAFDEPRLDEGSEDIGPPILGAPMPTPNARTGVLGQISEPKEDISPQRYAGEMASRKRMKKMPQQSPLGPITGGLKSVQESNIPSSPDQQASLGDRWMGEIWQGLTSEENPVSNSLGLSGIGYAHGGSVESAMDLYNQTISELESGGIGYAGGGLVDKSEEIASMGRNGDTMLMHINPSELQGLQSLLGPVSINPDTGNPEAFAWLVPLIGAAMGTIASGAMSDWELGPTLAGAGMGAMMGLGLGGLAGAGAGTAGSTGMAASSLPGVIPGVTTPSTLASGAGVMALPSTAAKAGSIASVAPSLAPGAGVLAPSFGGGVTASQAAGAGFLPTVKGTMAAGQAGLGSQSAPSLMSSIKGGLSSLGEKISNFKMPEGLGALGSGGGNRPAPPPASPPIQRRKSQSVDPRQFMRKPTMGQGLPGSRRIGG